MPGGVGGVASRGVPDLRTEAIETRPAERSRPGQFSVEINNGLLPKFKARSQASCTRAIVVLIEKVVPRAERIGRLKGVAALAVGVAMVVGLLPAPH
jgi:hypothetical protein